MRDIDYMQEALALAKTASSQNEIPVGAIIVADNQMIGRGYNQSISLSDPTAHAEIIALRNAAKEVKNYRLTNATLYVTLEPCLMCVGAIVHARVSRLVYGAFDMKTGAVQSVIKILDASFHNHKVSHYGGVLHEECRDLLNHFFKDKRCYWN